MISANTYDNKFKTCSLLMEGINIINIVHALELIIP